MFRWIRYSDFGVFRPGLIINRASGSSQVNVLYLRKILHQYVAGDLTLLGEIPDDPAVRQAVRKFLPVIEASPTSEAAKGLLVIATAVEHLAAAHDRKRADHAKQSQEKQPGALATEPEVTLPLLTSTRAKTDAPPSPHASKTIGRASG